MVLRPWQRSLLGHIFARRPDGSRKHRLYLAGMGRKNGKTALAAGIALYGLTSEGDGAEVYSCAADRKQAGLVFGTARRICELDSELSGRVRLFRDVIEDRVTGSVYRALSSEAYTKEGLSPTLVIYDELHAAPDRGLFDVMSLAMGARTEPILIAITTAGTTFDRLGGDSTCYGLYQYGKRVISGELEDSTFGMAWWEGEGDHHSPALWAAANPGLGDILALADLESAVKRTPEAEFRTKRGNQWVNFETAWLPAGSWDALQGPATLRRDLPLYVGVNVGVVHDSTAVVCVQRQDDRVVVRSRFWSNPYPVDSAPHDGWELDLEAIRTHLRDLRKLYPVTATAIDDVPVAGPAFLYDPAVFRESAQMLDAEGLAMVEVPQTNSRLVAPTRALYELITTSRIEHDGDPVLSAHLGNVVAYPIGESGWRLRRPRNSNRQIGGAIALVMAIGTASEPPPAPMPKYRAYVV